MSEHPTIYPHSVQEAIDRFTFVDGAGSPDRGEACVMTAVSWIIGADWTDDPPDCAHRLIQRLVVWTNDHDDTTPEDRERILRDGIDGIVDTWWVPDTVIAAAMIRPADDDRTPVARCLDTLGALAWWKHDKRRANLTGANLIRAKLPGADLAGANLTGAYLADAYLAGANLAGANLTDANLTDANLTRANLAGANLAGADLTGANLTGAYLADAYLADAYLADAYGNRWTRLPSGWVVGASGRIEREVSA